jgi:CDP-glycerol glycerophosphotransferase
MKKRLEYILKHNLIVQYVYKVIMSNVFRIIGLFVKTDPKLILFNSFGGRKYNDSPKVIFEHMINQDNYKSLDFVWAFEEPDKFNIPNCRKVKIDTLAYFLTALKAKYWVSSVNIERGLKFKKNNTIYLNTWHGAGTKKIGNSVKGRKDFDFSNVDIMLVQSVYEKEIFKRDFLVKDESFLICGFPRSDELFNTQSEKIEEYKVKFEIPKDKKVILYAPTWRESTDLGKSYELKPPIDINKWREKLGENYVVLFRMHAFTTKVMNLHFNDFVKDMSNYSDVNHLLLISDILITDYSTMVFDYSVLEKPFICFGYDYDKYCAERGLYIDLNKEYPNGVLKTEEDVLNLIVSIDYEKECEKVRKFKAKFIEEGGDATEKTINKLMCNFS